jgi:hypothetical protein
MKVVGSTSAAGTPGVSGQSLLGDGVTGLTFADGQAGVSGVGDQEHAQGVFGQSSLGTGVFGKSASGRAVVGWSNSNYGVTGDSQTFAGVRGTSVSGRGTEGWSTDGPGVYGISQHDIGVQGKGGRLAGLFEGHVEITGEIRMTNADLAEAFDAAGHSEPGAVVVLTESGAVAMSAREYDKKAIGVVSGAGRYQPGIILDAHQSAGQRTPVAMLGKVYCKVDADAASIEVGDMLTTSNVPGHAMKAVDPSRAFGAVIGKALGPLSEGRGLIPILVVLQ